MLQPIGSFKTIEELQAQVKALTSQNEHKEALVKYMYMHVLSYS